MTYDTQQEEVWAGAFGTEYCRQNRCESRLSRARERPLPHWKNAAEVNTSSSAADTLMVSELTSRADMCR